MEAASVQLCERLPSHIKTQVSVFTFAPGDDLATIDDLERQLNVIG